MHMQPLQKLCISVGIMLYCIYQFNEILLSHFKISNFWLYTIVCYLLPVTHIDIDYSPLSLVAATRASRMATVGQSTAQKVPLPRALQMRSGNFVYNNSYIVIIITLFNCHKIIYIHTSQKIIAASSNLDGFSMMNHG